MVARKDDLDQGGSKVYATSYTFGPQRMVVIDIVLAPGQSLDLNQVLAAVRALEQSGKFGVFCDQITLKVIPRGKEEIRTEEARRLVSEGISKT